MVHKLNFWQKIALKFFVMHVLQHGRGNFLREEKITRIRNLICRGSKQILWSGAGLYELARTSPVTLKLFLFR